MCCTSTVYIFTFLFSYRAGLGFQNYSPIIGSVVQQFPTKPDLHWFGYTSDEEAERAQMIKLRAIPTILAKRITLDV